MATTCTITAGTILESDAEYWADGEVWFAHERTITEAGEFFPADAKRGFLRSNELYDTRRPVDDTTPGVTLVTGLGVAWTVRVPRRSIGSSRVQYEEIDGIVIPEGVTSTTLVALLSAVDVPVPPSDTVLATIAAAIGDIALTPGPQGDPGTDGADGADGEDGASAYEIAVTNGFVGNEAAWLASLVGPEGPQGEQGPAGADGADGAPGADGATGATGATGPAGPTAVSADANNLAQLGSDSLLFVPKTVFAPVGLTGATQASRYVGATTSGAPVSGTFAVGDFVIDRTGKVWICTTAGTPGTWTQVGGSGGSAPDYIDIQDQRASGTNGGTFTSGAWQTRTLNTEVTDTGNHASLASNQITLAAGTYRCHISAPALRTYSHQARLQNITNGTTTRTGTTEYTLIAGVDSAQTRSRISGQFTIAESTVFEVQHRCLSTQATNGLGLAAGWGTEVYTVAEFWRVA